MKFLFPLFCLLLSLKLWAMPEKVEFWFISPNFTTFIPSNFLPKINFGAKLAEDSTQFVCEPMGDGCFHPQLGYFEDKAKVKEIPEESINEGKGKSGSFADREIQLVECRKGNFFDIYCGNEKKDEVNSSPLQVWVDTSSSLKHSDGETKTDECQRRLLVETMRQTCTKKDFEVHVYNVTKKELDTNSSLCLNKGTNSEDNLIRWVRESKAKRLLIITDIDEKTDKISAFIDEISAKVKGVGSAPLYAKSFPTMSREACSVLD